PVYIDTFGTLSIAGTLAGNLSTPVIGGSTFTLVGNHNQNSTTISGAFAGMPDGTVVSNTGGPVRISYHGGSAGLDVTLKRIAVSPALRISDVRVRRAEQYAVFTVTRDYDASGTATVHYATADGTAQAGVEYQATSGTLTFAPGELTKTISVPVNGGDPDVQPEETFFVNLTN